MTAELAPLHRQAVKAMVDRLSLQRSVWPTNEVALHYEAISFDKIAVSSKKSG